jgi:hypothetical protein
MVKQMYRYALLDPSQTTEAAAANETLFSAGPVFGVEVTVPELAKRCLANLDPQHLGGDAGTAAIELARSVNLPPTGAALATIKPDLDALGSMAVLTSRAEGSSFSPSAEGRLKIIAMSDKFERGPWPGPRELPTVHQLSNDQVASVENNSFLAAIAAAAADPAVPIERRVEFVATWIDEATEPPGYRDHWVAERRQLAEAIASGEIQLTVGGGLATVESTFQSANNLGYHLAPVVIARNPDDGEGGGAKYTISQWPDRDYVDLRAVWNELSAREPGWGGSSTIGGSPQGTGSHLPLEEVEAVVRKKQLT